MKKKVTICSLSVVCIAVVIVLIFVINNRYSSVSNVGGVDGPQVTYGSVQLIEEKSNTEESSYYVSAALSGTDFSDLSKTITDKIEQEWDTYEGLTEMQRLASSKAWGMIGYQCDTWLECEEAVGINVDNPLESVDWLVRTGHYGFDSEQAKHIQVSVSTKADRTPTQINISAGYYTGTIRITLTATLTANSETYTTGSVCNGYADYEQNNVSAGSGIPVLIVTTNEANNLGYYSDNYFDPTAYWVKDNVFYSVRVLGDESNKEQIRYTLERILAEF